MNRMTITVDPDLLDRAQEAVDAPTKAETIRIALTEIVRKRQLAAALQHRGRIELDLDQEALQRLRRDSRLLHRDSHFDQIARHSDLRVQSFASS